MVEVECEKCGASEQMWDEDEFIHLRSCAECGWAKFECDDCGGEVSVVL